MAWVRIHDGALSHPKIIGMFDWHDPFHVWVWGLSQSQMHLTDGLLTFASVPRMGRKAAEELVARNLWESVEGGWRVHDYLDWNDDRATVRRKREQSKTRGERFKKRVANSVAAREETTPTPLHSTIEPPNPLSAKGGRRRRTKGIQGGRCPHDPVCASFQDCTRRILESKVSA